MTASPDSKYLAERLIARLSPQRRSNLERRSCEALHYAWSGCNARGEVARSGMPSARIARRERMLGRLAALT